MKKLLLIVLMLLAVGAFAQSERTTDFGGIVSAESEVALGGPFGMSVEEELRFDHNFSQFDRWLNSVGVDYTCLHNRMNIGLTADYIRRHNDRGYYENRGRLVCAGDLLRRIPPLQVSGAQQGHRHLFRRAHR